MTDGRAAEHGDERPGRKPVHNGVTADLPRFAIRIVAAIALFGLAWLLWRLHDVLLLLFAAVLIAVILHAAAGAIRRFLPIPEGAALALAGILILAFASFSAAIFGREVSRQLSSLGDILPGALEALRDWIGADRAQALQDQLMPSGTTLAGWAEQVFAISTGVLSALVLAIVGGVYLAANPDLYRRGALRLLPRGARPAVRDFFDHTGIAMKRWLFARLSAMLVIGVITYAGLAVVGVPSALALGLIAGILEFVPFAGPILAAVPALLLALTVGHSTFFLTAGLYLVIQQIEGNLLTPLFLKQAVDLPPAVTLFTLFIFGAMFGVVGVLLAGPLTVVAYIAVRSLWMERALEEDVTYAAEED